MLHKTGLHMRLYLPTLLLLAATHIFGQNFTDGFQFYLPPGDSTAQRFLPEFPKITADQPVVATPDGDFEAGGQPIRFWGVNVTQGGCFPQKSKSPWIAARLRKMGFNLVRFLNMDNDWAGDESSIFYENSNTTGVLDFFALDRMHYFFAQLKSQGIYSNIALHSGRNFREGDGILHADSIIDNARAVSMFDREIIERQKQYALQLLTPVNPYTGISLADDPALAMIGIANSNTLYGYWKSDWLEHFTNGGRLQQRHVDTLNLRWNEFLSEKYTDQTALETTWNANATVAGQNEQAQDGGFELGDPTQHWVMELHDVAEATITADTENPFEGDYSGRVDVINVTPTNWHIQFKQTGATVEAGKIYTVTFAARAEDERTIVIVASRNNAPYNGYASQNIELTDEWQEYTFTFTPDEDNLGNLRLGFQFYGQVGSYWFDNFSLTDAEVNGLQPGESLADGNIRRNRYDERFVFTQERFADLVDFYLGLQRNYFNEMSSFLKDSLGVQANVSSNGQWSGISDISTLQDLDFTDVKFNWDYVRFPNGYSTYDWYIPNQAMVKYPYWTMANSLFGGFPIADKPLTISEYYHPFPNRYAAEMMPWMSAYGSFHGADAVMFYHYNYEYDAWTADLVKPYYSIHRHTAHMALSPLHGYAFREGLISPADEVLELDYSPEFLRTAPRFDNEGRWGKWLPYDQRRSFEHAIRVGSFEGSGAPQLDQLPPIPPEDVVTTSTGETYLNFEQGMLTTVTPQFVSVCGFLGENSAVAGPLRITTGNDFGVVSWLSLTENALPDATESVLAISARVQNTGMVWDGTTTVHDDWGTGPTEMQALELSIELNLNSPALALYPLDEMGMEGEPKYFEPIAPGKFSITIDQLEDETVWYGIEALESVPSEEKLAGVSVNISPNPASDKIMVEIFLEKNAEVSLRILDAHGRAVNASQNIENISSNRARHELDVSQLIAGNYFLEIKIGNEIFIETITVN